MIMRKTFFELGISMTICLLIVCLIGPEAKSETNGNKGNDFQDLSLDEMIIVDVPTVEGASKFEQILTEAPSSISLVTSIEIKKLGYRTLAEILQSLRGFDITYDRNYSYSGVRGYGRPGDYNDKILLLVDGHRINDNITNQAPLGTEFSIDIDLIDTIEIIRGPGSSLYGNNAFFAVIDVHTKSGMNLKGTEISGEAGSYETYKGRITYGNDFRNGFEALVSGTGFNSKGQSLYFPDYDTPATNNGIADNKDFDQFKSAFMKFSYKGFTLENSINSRTKGVPTGSFGADFNQDNQTVDGLFFSDLKYEKQMAGGGETMARLYYDYFGYTGDYIYSGIDNKDQERGERIGGEIKYAGTFLDSNKIVLGTEYLNNIKQQQQNYNLEPYLLYLDDTRKSQIFALYFQDEISLSKQIIVNAGIRYDNYDTFGSTFNPRLGFIYNPFQKSFIKLLYGSAFRAPNAYELYYTSPGLALEGNPNLQPETIQTYELIYDQYFNNGYRGTISGFYYKIKDLITQVTDPSNGYLVYENIDQVETRGGEFEVERKGSNGIEGRFSYSYQDVKNALTGAEIPNSPKQLVKANIIAPVFLKKVFVGIEEQYTSDKLTLAGNHTDSFYITNLTFSTHDLISKGLEVSASIYNLFDVTYSDPGRPEHLQDILQQNGINYRLKVTYLF
jgi:outer membrane receptor for ferrienterochelin and colicins